MILNEPARQRMRAAKSLAVIVGGALAFAACADDRSASGDTTPRTNEAPPMSTGADAPMAPATVQLADNPTIGEQVLVDSNGRTLYLFVPDGAGTESTVPADFKPNWPPVVATGMPVAGMGLNMPDLGVATQSDGTPQVTYNGHLLYTFIDDKAPGDANGQGLGPDNWFVLDANGDPIGMPDTASSMSGMDETTESTGGMGW